MRRSKIALLIGFALWLLAAEAQGQIQPQPVFQAKGAAVKIYDRAVAPFPYVNAGPFDVSGHAELSVTAIHCSLNPFIQISGGVTPASTTNVTEAADQIYTLPSTANATGFTVPIAYPYIRVTVHTNIGATCQVWIQPAPFTSGVVRGPTRDGAYAPGDGYNQFKPSPVVVGGWDGEKVYALKTDANGSLLVTNGSTGSTNTSAVASSVAKEVLVLTTSTFVPALPLQNRRAVEIQNQGPNSIFCRPDGVSPTVNGGREIKTGAAWSLDCGEIACQLRCIAATANQVTGAAVWLTELE